MQPDNGCSGRMYQRRWHYPFVLNHIRAMNNPRSTLASRKRKATFRRGAMTSRLRQLGLSLIELMVAMTIGLFLLLVISNLFIGSKQTYTNQDNLSRLQENGRFAIALLGKVIRESGYHNLSYTQPASMYSKLTNTDAWPYTTVNVVGGVDGGSSPDSITLSEDNTVDCLNAAVAVSPATNTYTVNGSAQLTCTSVNNGTTGVLLDNVEDMQILYGETVGTSIRYVSQSATAPVWANVTSVRVCLLMRTQAGGLTVTAQKYTDCNGTANQSKTDGRIRETFSETFTIRNMLP